jgi:hypothetical protein
MDTPLKAVIIVQSLCQFSASCQLICRINLAHSPDLAHVSGIATVGENRQL